LGNRVFPGGEVDLVGGGQQLGGAGGDEQ
jgi:hypothetical protein